MKKYPKSVYDLIEFLKKSKISKDFTPLTKFMKLPSKYSDEWKVAEHEGLIARVILSDEELKMIGESIPTNKLPLPINKLSREMTDLETTLIDEIQRLYLRITEEGLVAFARYRLSEAERKEQTKPPAKWSEAKSPTEWSKELGISATTLRRHVTEGKLVVDKISTKLWRIRSSRSEVPRWHGVHCNAWLGWLL